MHVLVTGGSGFLGAWSIRQLAAEGHQVRIFDRSDDRRLVAAIAGPAAAEAADWRTGDIGDPAAVRAAADGCTAILHLAGILTPDCAADPVRGATINLIGTLNIFQTALARDIRHIVYTSSAAVFGPGDARLPRPTNHYGAFKLACEGSARAYWQDHGLGSIGFRPYVVYGPGRTSGQTAGPSLACRAAARGEAYVIPYAGLAGLVHVEDVAAAYVAALRRPPDGAHVANLPGETADNDAVVAAIRRVRPDARITIDGPELDIAPDPATDPAARLLPGLPQTSLVDGIARTIAFHRQSNL